MSSYDDDQPDRAGIDSPNATHFRPSEAPPDKQRRFRRLWGYNEGLQKSPTQYDRKEIWRRDRLATLDAIASGLELTDHQHERSRSILNETDVEDFDVSTVSLEVVAFAICIYVRNQAVRPEVPGSNKYIPMSDRDKNPDDIEEFARDLDVSQRRLADLLVQIESGVCTEGDDG